MWLGIFLFLPRRGLIQLWWILLSPRTNAMSRPINTIREVPHTLSWLHWIFQLFPSSPLTTMDDCGGGDGGGTQANMKESVRLLGISLWSWRMEKRAISSKSFYCRPTRGNAPVINECAHGCWERPRWYLVDISIGIPAPHRFAYAFPHIAYKFFLPIWFIFRQRNSVFPGSGKIALFWQCAFFFEDAETFTILSFEENVASGEPSL